MSGERRTWALDEFHGGIDLRDGLFSDNQTRFRQLENLMVTKGKKLVRRPPCLKAGGALDSQTQGLVSIDGTFYTFAPKGSTIAHTGDVADLVETLYFDVPDLCTSTWTLEAAGVFDGYAAALIRHGFPSTTYPSLLFLHAWDGLVFAPTFCQDPYFPGSFSPSIADLTDQVFDADAQAVLATGVSKLWTATVRGNAQCSRTADARVWNQRTLDSIKTDGEHWCYVVPEGSGTRQFIVPRNADWMTGDGRWAYYVLEYNDGDEWVPMAEVSGTPTAAFTWSWASATSRFTDDDGTAGWDEIVLSVCWGRAGAGLVRLRLVAGGTALDLSATPEVTAVQTDSGWKLRVAKTTYSYRSGDTTTSASFTVGPVVPSKSYLLAVSADADGFAPLIDVTDGSFPNGWDREHRRIIKRITVPQQVTGTTEWDEEWTPTYVDVTYAVGSVDDTWGFPHNVIWKSSISTGDFRNLFTVGDHIRVNDEVRIITGLSRDTITVSAVFSATFSGKQIQKAYAYASYDSSKTVVRVDATLAAALKVDAILFFGEDFDATDDGNVFYKVSAIDGQRITITNVGGLDGDYTSAVGKLQPVVLTSQPAISDYQYAYERDGTEADTSGSAWFTDLVAEYVDLAGSGDALSIATAAQDNTGGQVSGIICVRNRMLVTFPGSMQLWSVDQDTNKTAFLDQLSFGTGDQDQPPLVSWYGSAVAPVADAFRAISVAGYNADNLQDLNIGEPIEPMPFLAACAAQFWPQYGQLIIAGTTDAGLEFRCLDYSRESKISAWSRWTVAGLSAVDRGTLIASGASLWFRSGTALHRFDASATTFRDFNDTAGAAYESVAFMHFNDMGKPGLNKRFVALDIAQDGTSSLAFALPPYGADFAASGAADAYIPAQTIEGISYGRSRLPMALTATAVALRISTRSETGWRLMRVALDFILLRR